MDFLINETFKDFDLFLENARAWHLDFVQLDRGEAGFHILQAGFGGSQIARARFSRKLLPRGQPPVGMRTFVIPVDPDLTLEWRGHQVGGCDLMIFPEGGELESVSHGGFDVITYSVPVRRLNQLSATFHLALAFLRSMDLNPPHGRPRKYSPVRCFGWRAPAVD